MTNEQDAFGHAVWDHFHGTNAFEIIERSDGLFAISSGPSTYLAEPAFWAPHEREALERHAHGRVLDIGCNAGRHALYLKQRGLEVVGVDVSPLAVAVAKARGVEKAEVLSIDEPPGDLGTFDTILMLGSNFGLFASAAKARRLLRRFKTFTSLDYLMVSPAEMEQLLAGTGWRIAKLYQVGPRLYTAIIERVD